MAVPDAVKRMKEEGLKKAEEMYKTPEDKKDDDGTPVAPAPDLKELEADKQPPVEPDKEPPVEPVVPVVDKTDNSTDWKVRAEKAEHQLKVMTGKYDAEVPRLTLENKHLRGEMAGLKDDFADFKKDAEINATTKKDAEQQQTVSDALNILDKELGTEALGAIKELIGANAPQQDLSSIEDKIDKVGERVDHLDSDIGQLSERDCQAEMTRLCPDWEQINASQGFKDWLKERDEITGYSYFDLLTLAWGEKNPVKSIAIFNRYKATLPTTPKVDTVAEAKQRELDALVAPGKGSSSDSTPKTEPRVYTRHEIKRFYDDIREGKYRGKERATMAAKIKEDIALANKEGRIAA